MGEEEEKQEDIPKHACLDRVEKHAENEISEDKCTSLPIVEDLDPEQRDRLLHARNILLPRFLKLYRERNEWTVAVGGGEAQVRQTESAEG